MMIIKVTAMAGISLECERKLSAHWHCTRLKKWKYFNACNASRHQSAFHFGCPRKVFC